MANEIKEISEIVKKCKILLLDIEGTTTSISFVKDKLFPYAEENVKQYLESQWETEDVKNAVAALRKLALEDKEKSVEGVVAIPGEDASKEEQIEGLVNNVKWQMSSDRKVGPLKQLQGLIWKQGYDSGDIKGHVYDDVSPALEQWRGVEGQKVYIYSSGSVDAQKLLFGQSLAGDMLRLIDGHFDTAVGAKQEPASYASIVEKIGCKADEILFLTDIVKEAEAARSSGLHAALVSRAGNAPLPPAADAFAVLHSFEQLANTNKRKPDDAQDEVPAKVAKTDVENDVKATAAEAETKVSEEKVAPKIIEPESEEKKTEEEKPEQMEVEEAATVAESLKEDKVEDVPMDGPVVKEVSDAKELENVPMSEAKPIITETEKTEEKETEKMDAEIVESEKSSTPNGTEEVKNSDMIKPNSEETSATVITEIEEVGEKQDLADVGEIIDDLEPVVEEPAAVEDMEDLQNVGEVLEKECDEILSKVQDVTNLDNIPLKPLLNPIVEEESMETENGDTNDIVDRILDSELELEMKQCEDIDLNTVQEITEPKEDAAEEKLEKVETETSLKEAAPKDEATTVIEENNVTDGNTSSSPTETVTKPKEDKIEEMVTEEAKKEETQTLETKTEETKTEKTVTKETKLEELKTDDTKMEETKTAETKSEETKMESTKAETPAVPETKVLESKEKESMAVESVGNEVKGSSEVVTKEENSTPTTVEKAENKENDKVPDVKDAEVKVAPEPQVNGKTTNGDAEAVNGDASSTEELKSRLSVEENGKKAVNGSNGDAAEAGQGDCKKEAELGDIKVKTVADVAGAGDEPRTDPIEQPTEA